MDNIIQFPGHFDSEPDLDGMDKEALLSCLESLRAEIARLDEEEPEDMESEEYEAWGDRHEELEDLVDEILDRLDELN